MSVEEPELEVDRDAVADDETECVIDMVILSDAENVSESEWDAVMVILSEDESECVTVSVLEGLAVDVDVAVEVSLTVRPCESDPRVIETLGLKDLEND